MIEPGMRVGGYVLDQEIGGGGAGKIWRVHATHSLAGSWQALKLLKPLEEGEARRDIHREVYALAKLRHPNIAHVSDVGIWHYDGERYPFLVMEFIEGETFSELAQKRVSWRVWSDLIQDVLQALAHAHAVGVIHRDIKPSNILVELDGRGERQAKLVDFGVARIVSTRPGDTSMSVAVNASQSSDGVIISGTPRYMAPEQIDARCGPIGPWTDLYALGCMLWRLLNLQGPFDGELYAILSAHLTREPGEFRPVIDVPDGIEPWLRWLMSKNPYERCRHAQEAATSLAALPPVQSSTSRLNALSVDETSASQPRLSLAQLRAIVEAQESGEAVPAFRKLRPSLPVQWDARTEKERSMTVDTLVHPVIWRHRPRQLVGRRAERDMLWGGVRGVVEHKRPCWISISGGRGVGKSHLQQWFELHVRELGVAQVLSVSCADFRQSRAVVRELVRGALWIKGFDGELLGENLQRFFVALGLSAELARVESAQFAAMLTMSTGEAHEVQDHEALFLHFLTLLCGREPVVLSLQGLAHHPSLADKLAQHFERAVHTRQPLLIVTVAEESNVLDVNTVSSMSEHLTRLRLEPLPRALQCRALASMLPLDQGSLQMLVTRTHDDLPLAVMHVHKWVYDGVFVQRAQEFLLESSMLDQIAPTPRDFWMRGVELWGEEMPDAQLQSMEIAAFMGEVVHEHLWLRCCRCIGVEGVSLYERLLDLGVLRGVGRGRWKFVEEILQALFMQRARTYGRAKAHHVLIAQVFEECESDDPIFVERAMEHWLDAERQDKALHMACATGERYATRSDLEGLTRVIIALHQIARESRASRERAQVYAALFSMVVALRRKELDEANRLAAVCMAMARLNRWSDLRARVQLELSVLHELKGEVHEAFEQLELAEHVICGLLPREMSSQDELLARRLLRYKAHLLIAMHRAQDAMDVLDNMEARHERRRGSHAQALVDMTRAHAMQQLGDQAQARELLGEVMGVFERTGDRRALTIALNRYGDLLRDEQPEQARVIFERVLTLLHHDEVVLRVNTRLRLALACMEMNDFAYAELLLREVLGQVVEDEQKVHYMVARLAMARCGIERGDEAHALAQVSRVRDLLHHTPIWYDVAAQLLEGLLGRVSRDAVMLRASVMDCSRMMQQVHHLHT